MFKYKVFYHQWVQFQGSEQQISDGSEIVMSTNAMTEEEVIKTVARRNRTMDVRIKVWLVSELVDEDKTPTANVLHPG